MRLGCRRRRVRIKSMGRGERRMRGRVRLQRVYILISPVSRGPSGEREDGCSERVECSEREECSEGEECSERDECSETEGSRGRS